MDGALVHDGWGLPEWVVKLRRRLRMDGQFFPKQPIQFEGRGRKISAAAISIEYVTERGSTSNAKTYTFSGTSIGAEAADRVVIVAAAGSSGSARSISSVTIGGVTASVAVTQASTSAIGARCRIGLYYLAVASGTTADIVVTFSGTMGHGMIAVFAMTGHTSETPAATGADGSGSTTFDPNCNVVTGDVLISASFSDGTPCAWTNSTEQSDATYESNLSTAKYTATSTETPRTITAVHTGGNVGCAVSAAWR